MRAVRLDLAAQLGDVDLQQVRRVDVARPPHLLQELRAA